MNHAQGSRKEVSHSERKVFQSLTRISEEEQDEEEQEEQKEGRMSMRSEISRREEGNTP